MTRTSGLNRRNFLRGAGGVAIALPLLESLPALAQGNASPRRMVCIGSTLGWVPDQFFPKAAGKEFALSPLLEPLAPFKSEFTVFNGLDHGVNAQGGHLGCHAFLSGVLSTNAKNYPDKNITVDQRAAEFVGAETRFASLQLSPETNDGTKMSWNRAGIGLVPIQSIQQTFDLLFRQDDAAGVALGRKRLRDSQSILDVVTEEAAAMTSKVGTADKERIDQYLTSVRELEVRLTQNEQWLDVPKPQPGYTVPGGADRASYKERLRMYYELMALALQTDSTRVISLELSQIGEATSGFNLSRGYHALSHHGKIPEVLDELHVIELFQMAEFANFLEMLRGVTEPDGSTLFDSTMSLIGTGLGNGS